MSPKTLSERTSLLERLEVFLATQPDTRGRVEIEFPYRTQAWHCQLNEMGPS